MGTTMPTASGKTPTLPAYWAKSQVLLYADNGRVCPVEFKQELDDEIFCLLHSSNSSSGSEDGYDSTDEYYFNPECIRKLDVCTFYLFYFLNF